jgi:membrane-bound lytic murein transglycosylase A
VSKRHDPVSLAQLLTENTVRCINDKILAIGKPLNRKALLREKQKFFFSILIIQIPLVFGLCLPISTATQSSVQALRPIQINYPTFQDDMNFKLLSLAIQRNLSYLKRLDPQRAFYYGSHQIPCRQIFDTQTLFLEIISKKQNADRFNKEIRKRFRIYRAVGRPSNKKVLFTGYYEPVCDARLQPDDTYKYPIYRTPNDLIKVDWSHSNKTHPRKSVVARIHNNRILPYYTRYEIEIEKVLEGKELEIAWLRDPVDVYLLHIQGAGRLKLPDERKILVNYHTSNGRPYRSFGRYLLDEGFLKRSELSIQRVRQYLTSNPEVFKKVLEYNDSYTFFRQVQEGPLGNIEVPLTTGRSLALDAELFPKGALAFMSSKKPSIDHQGKVTGWSEFSRFVLNQDTGSAIKGPGRADLFWGTGQKAEAAAWQFKQEGDLYMLIKKH